jgi:hypothetical protein
MNEAKQKAVELVEKFAPIMPNENWHDRAKQCAIILCDEILKISYFTHEPTEDDELYKNYWLQVKDEIEQLN